MPAPLVLFDGFGESSLDFVLYAWSERYEDYGVIRSALALGVYRVLHDAGIEIPFPQREVHVRSVEPEVARALRATDGADGTHDRPEPTPEPPRTVRRPEPGSS